jgi:hypothetical protein
MEKILDTLRGVLLDNTQVDMFFSFAKSIIFFHADVVSPLGARACEVFFTLIGLGTDIVMLLIFGKGDAYSADQMDGFRKQITSVLYILLFFSTMGYAVRALYTVLGWASKLLNAALKMWIVVFITVVVFSIVLKDSPIRDYSIRDVYTIFESMLNKTLYR